MVGLTSLVGRFVLYARIFLIAVFNSDSLPERGRFCGTLLQ